uniref:Uncharacterized protein n=1 Tax=Arion vulgaris TaxID=1028688 RepID=A0A0B6ZE31_9EUPU
MRKKASTEGWINGQEVEDQDCRIEDECDNNKTNKYRTASEFTFNDSHRV